MQAVAEHRRLASEMDVRAVVFDVGGVLTTSPFDLWAEYAEEIGLGVDGLWDALRDGGPDGAFARFGRGELTLEEVDVAYEGFPVAEIVNRTITGLEVRLEVVRAAERLREAGLKLGVLTNDWPLDGPRRYSSSFEWDFVVRSSVEGIAKPDPRIYEITCERLGVEPQAAVFLDDLEHNVEGARQVGMHGTHFVDPDEALAELERLAGVSLRA